MPRNCLFHLVIHFSLWAKLLLCLRWFFQIKDQQKGQANDEGYQTKPAKIIRTTSPEDGRQAEEARRTSACRAVVRRQAINDGTELSFPRGWNVDRAGHDHHVSVRPEFGMDWWWVGVGVVEGPRLGDLIFPLSFLLYATEVAEPEEGARV